MLKKNLTINSTLTFLTSLLLLITLSLCFINTGSSVQYPTFDFQVTHLGGSTSFCNSANGLHHSLCSSFSLFFSKLISKGRIFILSLFFYKVFFHI